EKKISRMAATPNIYTQKFPTITTQNYIASNISCFISFRKQSRKLVLIVGNSSSSDTASAIGTDETSPVEIPPSIISALNVEKALLGIECSNNRHRSLWNTRTFKKMFIC
ncbi:hypothetical protein AABB24_011919, partial [Solanum stoloniferum]